MEVKARILQQSQALFLCNGIKGVSMEDIAALLLISKRTLCKVFTNKNELVEATMAAPFGLHLVRLSRWADAQFSTIHPSIVHDLRKFHHMTWALLRAHQHTFILGQIT